MTRTGFFGGTFDPIHNGHLNLALSLLEAHGLDRVLFCPANRSPGKKENGPIAPNEMRKKMVELAIAKIPQFALCDLELKREGPSYTIETIRLLIKQNPNETFFLILGEDMLEGLEKWKEVETLLELAPPLVGTRPSNGVKTLPKSIQDKVVKGRTLIQQMEISSTLLRERLHKKMYCGHLIPSKVLDFIEEKRLY